MFSWKVLQNPQENTYDGVLFLVKLQDKATIQYKVLLLKTSEQFSLHHLTWLYGLFNKVHRFESNSTSATLNRRFCKNFLSKVIETKFHKFFIMHYSQSFRNFSCKFQELDLDFDLGVKVPHLWPNWQLHRKWSFLLRVSSVNVTKFAGNSGFGNIYWRNP